MTKTLPPPNEFSRYWAGYCIRKAQDMDICDRSVTLDNTIQRCQTSGLYAFPVIGSPHMRSREEMKEAMLLCYITSGLCTTSLKTAFRCLLQAERNYQHICSESNYTDAMYALRTRVEDAILQG